MSGVSERHQGGNTGEGGRSYLVVRGIAGSGGVRAGAFLALRGWAISW